MTQRAAQGNEMGCGVGRVPSFAHMKTQFDSWQHMSPQSTTGSSPGGRQTDRQTDTPPSKHYSGGRQPLQT